MRTELDEKLHNDFDFFKGYCGRGCEISCGDGWFDLVYELCTKLKETVYDDFFVSQVKEKLGGLRFYVHGAKDEEWDLISEYEEKSYTICEGCGKPGEIKKIGGWFSTACDSCNENILKNLTNTGN